MKKLYIASDEKEPVGVVAAKNIDLAYAYFTGRNQHVVHMEEINLNNPEFDQLPVMILLTSKKSMDRNNSYAVQTRKWRRGG